MRKTFTALTLGALAMMSVGPAYSQGPTGGWLASADNHSVHSETWHLNQPGANVSNQGGASPAGYTSGGGAKYEYRLSPACAQAVGATTGPVVSCSYALTVCAHSTPPGGGVLLNVLRRVAGSGDEWEFVGTTCRPGDVPGAPAAPPVPTMAQIEQAFKELPFAMPVVKVQPEKGTTLVNLPTFYRVEWPDSGLSAGETSQPVTLLGWTLRFKIGVASYTYRFGDGTSSDPTTDPGGTYPDGTVRHTYTAATTAQVKVDAVLTAKVSINGGPFEPLDTTADLTDEPVTTLSVRSATNRLVSH